MPGAHLRSQLMLGMATILTLWRVSLAAQTVQGVVTDSATGRPLVGAQVSIVGTTKRAVSGSDGRYALSEAPVGPITLRAQMIGYAPVEHGLTLEPTGTAQLDFALMLRPIELEPVVAIGYGTVPRENLATAVSTVSAEDIQGIANASPDAALQGKATGVQVSQNAGTPGNAISVRVRGAASITASSQPLYVVDGVPLISEDLSQTNLGGQGIRAITGLAADDIASIDVLKDAAAASIYGSRGSNGVVQITTKRGQRGKGTVSFNSYVGTQSASHKIPLLNSTEYLTYMNEAAANDGYGPDYFGTVGVTDSINTDWQDAVFRSAAISGIELAAAGGTDQIVYRISGNWFDQQGVMIGTDYRRIGGRVNLDFFTSPRLHFSTSLAVSGERNHRPEGDSNIEGPLGNAITHEPFLPVKKTDGTFTSTADGLQYANAVALATYDQSYAYTTTVLGSGEARYDLGHGFGLTGHLGMDLHTLREQYYRSSLIPGTTGAGVGGIARRGYTTANRYVAEAYLDWKRLWGGRHDLTLTGGAGTEQNRAEIDYVGAQGLGDSTLHEVSNGTTPIQFAGNFAERNLVSFFGRANYTLSDRYLLGLSFREDGSSVFGPDNRYGFFPGASLAWVASREPFLAGNRTLSLVKLRGSLGRTGNQAIGNYPWQGLYCSDGYGTEAGYYPCTLGNPHLTWEKTTQADLGFDLELWHGRAAFTMDWYHKSTSDLLLARPISLASGYTTVVENVGGVVNKGVELAVTAVPVQPSRADGFRAVATLNLSFNRNRVTELYNGQPIDVFPFFSIQRVMVGQPLGVIYGYRFTGVDPATGDAQYQDLDGDGTITAADQAVLASPWPVYTGGLTAALAWNRFDLSGFFQFTHGASVINGIRLFSDDAGYQRDNKYRDVLNRWQKPGDVTDEPRASRDGTSNALLFSNRFIEDGSYFRLQDLTLGYQLPRSVAGTFGLATTRVYVRGQNVFTLTHYTAYNPEGNSSYGTGPSGWGATAPSAAVGFDFYSYPLARTWSFGFQAGW